MAKKGGKEAIHHKIPARSGRSAGGDGERGRSYKSGTGKASHKLLSGEIGSEEEEQADYIRE